MEIIGWNAGYLFLKLTHCWGCLKVRNSYIPKIENKFLLWLSGNEIWQVSMRTQLWSLASFSGLRIRRCGGGHRSDGDPVLLWLWCRPGALAPFSTPSLGTSICRGCGPKKDQKKKKIENRRKQVKHCLSSPCHCVKREEMPSWEFIPTPTLCGWWWRALEQGICVPKLTMHPK